MTNKTFIEQLATEIRQIYASDPLQAETMIETYLEKRLESLPNNEKPALLKNLIAECDKAGTDVSDIENIEAEVLARLFTLLLGGKVAHSDLSTAELFQKLAESLNTIFDSLNQLVSVINTTLLGEYTGDETIRQVIGFHLEGENQSKSLESYLGQISKAFLLSQKAFKKAAHTIVSRILLELEPDQIAKQGKTGLKFGPLRKAELFEIYEEKFIKCKKWFESGRFMEDFLREFEKNCQEHSL